MACFPAVLYLPYLQLPGLLRIESEVSHGFSRQSRLFIEEPAILHLFAGKDVQLLKL
jgi:hypothetical protein